MGIYNKNFEGEGITESSKISSGINEGVFMRFFGLKKDEGKEAKLVVEWEDPDGKEMNQWVYRQEDTPEKRKHYDEKVSTWNNPRYDTYEKWLTNEQKDIYHWIKHVVCAYTSHVKFEEKVASLPEDATFEQFINGVATLLPQNYQQYKGKLKVGYVKDSAFPCVPTKMYMGRFWKLDDDSREDRELVDGDNKYFKYQPFGKQQDRTQAEQANTAPKQEQGETNW